MDEKSCTYIHFAFWKVCPHCFHLQSTDTCKNNLKPSRPGSRVTNETFLTIRKTHQETLLVRFPNFLQSVTALRGPAPLTLRTEMRLSYLFQRDLYSVEPRLHASCELFCCCCCPTRFFGFTSTDLRSRKWKQHAASERGVSVCSLSHTDPLLHQPKVLRWDLLYSVQKKKRGHTTS